MLGVALKSIARSESTRIRFPTFSVAGISLAVRNICAQNSFDRRTAHNTFSEYHGVKNREKITENSEVGARLGADYMHNKSASNNILYLNYANTLYISLIRSNRVKSEQK